MKTVAAKNSSGQTRHCRRKGENRVFSGERQCQIIYGGSIEENGLDGICRYPAVNPGKLFKKLAKV
jgi:hypothetical protein